MNSKQKVRQFFIYKITNIINNSVYIGKSVNPNKRFQQHLDNPYFNSAKNDCPKLYNSIRKYGESNFKMEVINFFEDEATAYDAEHLYIIYFDSKENGLNSVVGGFGFLSAENNPMYGNGHLISGEKNGMHGKFGKLNPFYGKKHSKESIKKMNLNENRKQKGSKNYFFNKSFKGENHPKCLITEEMAKSIIQLLKDYKIIEIMKMTKVSRNIIENIKYKKNWLHLPRDQIMGYSPQEISINGDELNSLVTKS